MLKFIEKIKAARECADKGHIWKYAGMAWDYDGGMGGGRPVRKLVCARCGARSSSVFGNLNEHMEEETADA